MAMTTHRFELHYQPQLRIGDERVTGFEALVRWRHPTRGLVAPDVFIPIAEQSTLIVQIGAWVLREACREGARWPGEVSVGVNVSGVQLRHGDLVATVSGALAEAGLAPSRLVLEFTASSMGEGSADAAPGVLRTLHRLRDLGVRILMDDLWTGGASGSTFAAVPLDRLKIDRSFVTRLGTGGGDAAAIAAVRRVVGVAHRLGVPAVASGVETRGQLATLAAEDCIGVQGFLYSAPVPAKQALAYLTRPAARVLVA